MPKQAETERDGEINPQNYNIIFFLGQFRCYESTEVDSRTWLRVPSGTLWSTSNDAHQGVEI